MTKRLWKYSLFLSFTLIFQGVILFARQYPAARSLDIEDGLSNNSVRTIYKDKSGYMWIGTHDGLNRYDGYEFKTFRNSLADSSSLPHNYIYAIAEDMERNIWVATGQGVSITNNLSNKFSPAYFTNQKGITQKISVQVNTIFTNPQGIVFIGTNGGGLLIKSPGKSSAEQLSINYQGKKMTNYSVTSIKKDLNNKIWLFIDPLGLCSYDPKTKKIVAVNTTLSRAYCIEVDNNNDIWIGTKAGLYRYQVSKSILSQRYTSLGSEGRSEHILCLNYEKSGKLYIGTKGGGLVIMNTKTGKFETPHFPSSSILEKQSIPVIYRDSSSSLWFGTSKAGVLIMEPNGNSFKTIAYTSGSPNSLVGNYVSCFLEDEKGKILIGTDGAGLSIWNRKDNSFANYTHSTKFNNSLSSNLISDMKRDFLGDVWIASFGGGINRMKKGASSFEHFKCFNSATGIENENVWQLIEDHQKVLWATTFSNGTLYYFNRNANQFKVFDEKLLENLFSIREDRKEVLWTGNSNYLIKIDRKEKKHVYYPIGKPVRVIFEDGFENLWLGTEGGGLILFDRKSGKVKKRFSTVDGLCNNSILAINEDAKGNLWISTFSGLSRFNAKKVVFLNFFQEDGLQSNQFIDNSTIKLKSGELIFGGLKGFNIFNPDSILIDRRFPPVAITDIRVNNHLISPEDDYVSKLVNNEITGLKIPFQEAVLSVDFAALEFKAPGKIRYAYYLEGWDKGWNYTNRVRTAIYTRLSEGNYKLHIKSSNIHGQWLSSSKTLIIRVLPPWYRSIIAYICYVALVIGILYICLSYLRRRSQMKHQIELANLKLQQEHEISEEKLSFFTHISHEFRTPLTLIINPVQEFLNSQEGNVDPRDLIIVYRNARRLLSLVDQLMLFRKSEAQEINKTIFNFVSFCEEIYVCFAHQAKSKHIKFDFLMPDKEIYVSADREKMEVVLYNLISNAFKFTPRDGNITLSVRDNGGDVEFHVIDSGKGINIKDGDKIFERFYRAPDQSFLSGFGVGLFLVKKFIEVHSGKVSFESSANQGTDFKVIIPKGTLPDKLYPKENSVSTPTVIPAFFDDLSTENTKKTQEKLIKEETDLIYADTTTEKKTILIVDDDTDIRSYIKQIFSNDYLVYEAKDGHEGYSFAKNSVPDLIITDMIMKELNGVELCMKIKSDPSLTHIPVIILTSSSSPELKLKGIEQGADDFITKPFEKNILMARVANLLRSRNTLQQYFLNEITLKSEDSKISPEYKSFLESCINITEKHLDDPDFSVKMLADELAISPSILYRKVKSISGKTTNEFIRYIRLRKAAQLLINTDYNINQTAIFCGFVDVRYFREQFSKLFGIRPSDFKKKYKGNLSPKHRVLKN
ncbi:hypothetical protein ASU31_00650 [Pedobacter ginsenosidimutans]|uniref:histidine kinase n=1 Tax=Pedobacter ginsenosidimutans TaxID=687842 RepID=A0A0T5VVP9_9SPHI|nr:two-component regulator propeller domain-containing protein [Pedobacter ginsenosidimutans]KRT17839.1 hypothetical protein ASU31_00650 [Pedobacter ginsenosidimutans]